jgi:multidrug resistance efflux pump
MIELFLCSLVTVLPDYLYRRFAQGKRFGHEINFFTVWYVLRWGLSGCVILTLLLITMIFYFHPATKDVTMFFRTVTILPEVSGRVSAVSVANFDKIKAGDEIFRLEDSRQTASLASARAKIAEVQATMVLAQAEQDAAKFQVANAEASLTLAETELARVQELRQRGSSAVSDRDLDIQQSRTSSLQAQVSAARSNEKKAAANLTILLPAQLISAQAAVKQAEVELEKTIVRAGTDGQVMQFALQVGDYINPILRPAGILVPEGAWSKSIQAGFNQISAQVVKPGVITELSCISVPLTVIPMVVVNVQDAIAAGQMRPTDQLLEIQTRAKPGTIVVRMEPLYENDPAMDKILPGTKCIANAYTNNHDRIASGELSTLKAIGLHAVDATGLVHALILRIQTLLLPIQTLVLTGH